MVFDQTSIKVKSMPNSNIKIKSSSLKQKSLFNDDFKFEDLGVGGLDEQIGNTFRRAFSSRRLPIAILEKYGK
jgi:vesicle-fusing ATPase